MSLKGHKILYLESFLLISTKFSRVILETNGK